ncbi:cupin domain-containing protein [Pelagibius sp. Alg239-R121]|uniref:cupin domain-containing protein n=1 Tax=Pelagibius sp. Alg239-R121 TaxID=2993448 RepID=UPI0024A78D07|nr:cupin domain-containing protein [Pelagibius sp. Alg239-R121]
MTDTSLSQTAPERITAAEVVLPCTDLPATMKFFNERLGFRLDAIFPADGPATAVISGHGLRIRLSRDASEMDPGRVSLRCADPKAVAGGETELTAPNGTRIELVEADPPLALPPIDQSFVVTKMGGDAAWGVGRAGMRYRDLIPNRQGGRFIASHIAIPDGGLVPDMVHFHKARFQMIYCYKGWVHLLYEDQGPQFTMKAGDCVLQPPEIRHRVLECSPGFEVIEIGCPADHMTCIDHEMPLPNGAVNPDRVFNGQRFVRHQADKVEWQPGRLEGVEFRDIGIAAATDGLASAQVWRLGAGVTAVPAVKHAAEFVFYFVLEGAMTLQAEGQGAQALSAGDSFVVPEGMVFGMEGASADLELLEVALPADYGVELKE